MEDMGVVPVVKPPLQLFKVAVHMLDADMMERPDDGALEEAPHTLNPISVHVTDYPFLNGVVNGLVARVVVRDTEIGFQLVGVDGLGLVLDGAGDEAVERLLLHVGDALKPDFPVTLDSASDDGFVALVPPALALLLSAHIGLVHLDHTNQRGTAERVVSHGFTNAVAKMPRRAVGGPESALKLVGGHALLGLAHEVNGGEPLSKRQVGIVHDSPGGYGELIAA